MELLRMIRKRPALFFACVGGALAPVIIPLVVRAAVVYFVGPR